MLQLKLPRDVKSALVEDVQAYFQEELSEPIGNLAAEGVLDYVTKLVAPFIYNQAIADARKLVTEQMERIDEELSFLEQQPDRRR